MTARVLKICIHNHAGELSRKELHTTEQSPKPTKDLIYKKTMRRPSYKFEARTRDYRLVVCIDLMTEYLQTVDKNTKQLTLYEFQERINREYEKIPTVQ
jgi:mRNA-degrading endonuclease RelE of RelBE toxin-antitoxin system